jgi:hypothetical protein
MFLFVLLLLLLAAAFGVLGAVLKAVVFLVLTVVLTVVALAALGTWWVRRRIREAQRAYDRHVSDGRAPQVDPGRLPPSHDDRY